MSKEHTFIKKWIDHNTKLFMKMYPDIDKKDIKKFLKKKVEENIQNRSAEIHNSYIHKSIKVDLLTVIDWIVDTKPILGGFGVFFKNQDQSINPDAVMLQNFINTRKAIKKYLHVYEAGSYEYKKVDREQMTEKINANSHYGAGGAKTSNFYNLYTAVSTTATGQSLTSTTTWAFENFIAGNFKFSSLDQCLTYIKNITGERYNLDDSFLPKVTVGLLIDYLRDKFYEYRDDNTPIIRKYLSRLSQSDLKRIYFKNNIREFSKTRKIRGMLDYVFMNTTDFKNPNKLPEETADELNKLWSYYKEFVLYNYPTFDRIRKFKTNKRKAVVGADTDSNMIYLGHDWVDFINKNVISVNDDLLERDKDTLLYISINTMCFFMTNMITEVLKKYTKGANILKDYRHFINMKNELLFMRAMFEKKKRYIASIRLREGTEIYPEKIDLKGVEFLKSTTRQATREYFVDIIRDKILYRKKINVAEVLNDLEQFEAIIYQSLTEGKKDFLIPKSVKEIEGYKDPFSQAGFLSVFAWNIIYPDNQIDLPEKIDLVKVNMSRIELIEDLQKTEPEIYERIVQGIFNSPIKEIAKKGITAIAVPRVFETVPEWIRPYIDYGTIVSDNLTKFQSVTTMLSLETAATADNKYFSNILKL